MVTIVRLVFVGLVLAWVWMFPTDPFFHSGEGPDNGVRVIESHVFFAQAVIAVALILFIVFPIMPVFQSRWRRGKLRYWLLQPLLFILVFVGFYAWGLPQHGPYTTQAAQELMKLQGYVLRGTQQKVAAMDSLITFKGRVPCQYTRLIFYKKL